MAKKIELENGRVWKTQSAALEHFKGMLARYEDNDTVDDLEDHEDLLALLERYDQLDLDEVSKVGCGIDYFEYSFRNIICLCFIPLHIQSRFCSK